MLILNVPRARSLSLAAAALLCSVLCSPLVNAQDASQKPPAAASAAPKAPNVSAKVKLTSLEEWDSQVDMLLRLSEQVYGGRSEEDLGGHGLEYYWQQYVFAPATREKLEMLRDQAQKQTVAKDTAGLQRTLDAASAIFSAEQTKGILIVAFFTSQTPVNYHQYQLGPWLARATDADRQGINDRVTATYANLSKELQDAMKQPDADTVVATSQRFVKVISEPLGFFNAERARLVKAQADLPSPFPVSPRTRGDKPCPAPVPPAKGHDRPSLGADFPSSEAFYPPTAKQNEVEGAVTLRVTVSETGCIQKAEIAGTSGVAQLDESALDLAMAGSYVPGAGPGDKPTAGTMMFRVKFELPDRPGTPR